MRVNILHVVATVALMTGGAAACHAGTFVGETGGDTAAASLLWTGSSTARQAGAHGSASAARHSADDRALVFGPQSGGYFAESYGAAPRGTRAMVMSVAAANEAADFVAPPASQHEDMAASGDTFVFTALSSKLASTPEPASLALLGTGALSAVAMLRRRVH